MSRTRMRIAALATAGAVLTAGLPATVEAVTGTHWTRVQCQRALLKWAHNHPGSTVAQRKAYMRTLNKQHGCSFKFV